MHHDRYGRLEIHSNKAEPGTPEVRKHPPTTSMDEYIRQSVSVGLPWYLQWVLECVDPAKLRAGYENGIGFCPSCMGLRMAEGAAGALFLQIARMLPLVHGPADGRGRGVTQAPARPLYGRG